MGITRHKTASVREDRKETAYTVFKGTKNHVEMAIPLTNEQISTQLPHNTATLLLDICMEEKYCQLDLTKEYIRPKGTKSVSQKSKHSPMLKAALHWPQHGISLC